MVLTIFVSFSCLALVVTARPIVPATNVVYKRESDVDVSNVLDALAQSRDGQTPSALDPAADVHIHLSPATNQDDLLAQIARLDPSADAVRAILPLDPSKAPTTTDERALYDLLEHAGVKASLDELEGGYRPVLVGADGELLEATAERNATEDASHEQPQPEPTRAGWLGTSPLLSLSLSCATALLGLGCVSLGLYAYHGSRKMLGLEDDEKTPKEKDVVEKGKRRSHEAPCPREKAEYGLGLGLTTEPNSNVSSPVVDDCAPDLDKKAFPILPADLPSCAGSAVERVLDPFSTSNLPAPVFSTPPTSPLRIPVLLTEDTACTPPHPDTITLLPLLASLPSLVDLALTSPPSGPAALLSGAVSPAPTRLPLPLHTRSVPKADARPDAPAWSLRASEATSPLPPRLPMSPPTEEVPECSVPPCPPNTRARSPMPPGALLDSPVSSTRALAARPETHGRLERLTAARAVLALVDVADPAWMVRVLIVLVGWVFGVVGGRGVGRLTSAV